MYVVMYAFKVKSNEESSFLESWCALTKLIYQYEGSLGSRLHKKDPLLFIAYAQWPSKKTFENAGKRLHLEANTYREAMRNACESIEVLEKLEVTEDLLMKKVYD